MCCDEMLKIQQKNNKNRRITSKKLTIRKTLNNNKDKTDNKETLGNYKKQSNYNNDARNFSKDAQNEYKHTYKDSNIC